MTCKDCIGYPFCSRGRNGRTNYYGKDAACNSVEYLCNDFKNKADFVEVVRCKDCVKDDRFDCPLCYIEKQTMQFINHDAEFYCGFGERK